MNLGQTLLMIMNSMKEMAGAQWDQFYEQKVDIRHRQIIRNNFGFF